MTVDAQGLFQKGASVTPATVSLLEELDGGEGGAGTLAQVLTNSGDPEGHAITDKLLIRSNTGDDVIIGNAGDPVNGADAFRATHGSAGGGQGEPFFHVNPLTGIEVKSVEEAGGGTTKAVFCVDGSDATLKVFDQEGSAGAALAVSNDADTEWPFWVTNEGCVQIDTPANPSNHPLRVIFNTTEVLKCGDDGELDIGTASIFISGIIPTADPHVAGQIFRVGNDLKISTG